MKYDAEPVEEYEPETDSDALPNYDELELPVENTGDIEEVDPRKEFGERLEELDGYLEALWEKFNLTRKYETPEDVKVKAQRYICVIYDNNTVFGERYTERHKEFDSLSDAVKFTLDDRNARKAEVKQILGKAEDSTEVKFNIQAAASETDSKPALDASIEDHTDFEEILWTAKEIDWKLKCRRGEQVHIDRIKTEILKLQELLNAETKA